MSVLPGCVIAFSSSQPGDASSGITSRIYTAVDKNGYFVACIYRLMGDGLRVQVIERPEDANSTVLLADGTTSDPETERGQRQYYAERTRTLERLLESTPQAQAIACGDPIRALRCENARHYQNLRRAMTQAGDAWWRPVRSVFADARSPEERRLLDMRREHESDSLYKAAMPPHQDAESFDNVRGMMGQAFDAELMNRMAPDMPQSAFIPTHIRPLTDTSLWLRDLRIDPRVRPRIYIAYDPAKGTGQGSNAILLSCVVHSPTPRQIEGRSNEYDYPLNAIAVRFSSCFYLPGRSPQKKRTLRPRAHERFFIIHFHCATNAGRHPF